MSATEAGGHSLLAWIYSPVFCALAKTLGPLSAEDAPLIQCLTMAIYPADDFYLTERQIKGSSR
jgi:hypothetical protein